MREKVIKLFNLFTFLKILQLVFFSSGRLDDITHSRTFLRGLRILQIMSVSRGKVGQKGGGDR